MTGSEKIEAAFSKAGSAEVPVVIPYEGILVRDHWVELTSHPWWYARSPRLENQIAWRRDAFAAIGQDSFDLPDFFPAAGREEIRIEERADGVYLVNGTAGKERRLEPPVVSGDWIAPGGHVGDGGGPASREEVEACFPPLDPIDPEAFRAAGHADLANRLMAEFGRDMVPLGWSAGPLWQACSLWGYEGTMARIVEEPDLVARACRGANANAISGVQAAAALGCRLIWIEDCWTDAVSPAAFKALNVSALRDLTAAIRSLGMLSVYYFCGNPAGKLDLILDAGADAYGLEESKKNFRIEIGEIAERVNGRSALFGNLDAIGVLQNGSEDQLRAALRTQIAAGRRNRGRFVMSLGSPVTPGTRVTRVKLYCEMTRELGRS